MAAAVGCSMLVTAAWILQTGKSAGKLGTEPQRFLVLVHEQSTDYDCGGRRQPLPPDNAPPQVITFLFCCCRQNPAGIYLKTGTKPYS